MNTRDKVIFEGSNSFTNLLIYLKKQKQRLFIVTGKASFIKNGAKSKISKYFVSEDYFIFNDFSPNPKIEDVSRGLNQFQKFKNSVILVIGGGSAMDMGKLIHGANEYKATFKQNITKGIDLNKIGVDVYFVPSTTGSGSEATNFSVVYINKQKFSVINTSFFPKGVCLDPLLCMSMSTYQRAISGFDAFSQAIESLWAIGATKDSKKYAHQSLSLITSNIYMNVNFPNVENTKAMLQASHMSGKAINISKTTVPHALSYYLTTFYDIPHGHAVSLFLGFFLKSHYLAKDNKISDKLENVCFRQNIQDIFIYLKSVDGIEAKNKWYCLMESCGLSTNLDVILKNKIDKKKLINSVNIQRLMNNPIKYTGSELLEVLND